MISTGSGSVSLELDKLDQEVNTLITHDLGMNSRNEQELWEVKLKREVVLIPQYLPFFNWDFRNFLDNTYLYFHLAIDFII